MDKLLNEAITKQLQEIFTEMIHPVEVLFFGSQHNPEVTEFSTRLLGEVRDVGGQVTLSLHDIDQDADLARQYRLDKAPGFVILGVEPDGSRVDYGVRFAGFPGSYEFNSFINALMLVSRRASTLKAETLAALAEIKKPVHLMVFVTPT